MVRYVLSVDGGGIRGIIPTIVLAEIQKRLINLKKSLPEIFDLMVGTSTGGIVVAGLAKKNSQNKPEYAPIDLLQLYKNYGPYIFKPSFLRQEILYWFNGAKYSYRNIEFVLNKYFGEDTMGNASTNILFTSYDIHNNCPFFFKSWKDPGIALKDALRSTTAAPTYFIPKCLRINDKNRVLVDSGIVSNNPSAVAYVSAKELFPNDDIVLLSIGTGKKIKNLNYADVKKFGKIGWIHPLINVMFYSELAFVDYLLEQTIGDNYIRIQSELKLASNEMDNITMQNIELLQEESIQIVEDNKELIERFCRIVRSRIVD